MPTERRKRLPPSRREATRAGSLRLLQERGIIGRLGKGLGTLPPPLVVPGVDAQRDLQEDRNASDRRLDCLFSNEDETP